MISNICRANFNGGRTAQGNNRYQWDYGQILEISGIENLPDPFAAQFSNTPVLGTAKTAVGTGGRVEIPNEYFVSGQNIYCFIVLHTDEDDGRTVYIATIPVTKRPKPIDDPITPTQQSTIDTAIAALQAGVAKAEGFAGDAEEQATIATGAATTATEAAETATGAVADVEAAATRAETAAGGAEASATAADAAARSAGQSAQTAQDAMNGAVSAAESASDSAQDADTARQAAQAAEQDAQAAKTAAEASATAAAGSASAASGSASQAAQKAAEAASNATAAQTSATNAEAAKTDAETARTGAETAQGKAEEAAGNAEQSATTAEWYAERVERFLPTDTASGEIASFPDGADGVPMQSVVVTMEPVQDLHGYDHPWPAGGGKNLLPCNASVRETTIDGVAWKINDDGSVSVSGTATAASTMRYAMDTEQRFNGNYKFYVFPGNISTSDFQGGVKIGAKWFSVYANGTKQNLADADGTLSEAWFQVREGKTVNATFYPMIYSAEESDPTAWTPYENLCPISGRTGADIEHTGVNVWDEEWENGRIHATTGENISGNGIRSNFIPVVPSTTYYAFRGDYTGASSITLYYYDAEKRFISYENKFGFGAVFTTPSSARYLRLNIMTSAAVTAYNHDISINYPSTDTAYHAYQGETISVTFPSEAGIVYGCTLGVVSGDLVVDRAMVDLGTLNWVYNVSGTRFDGTTLTNLSANRTACICSQYVASNVDEGWTNKDKVCCIYSTRNSVFVKDTAYTDAAEFKAAMNGVQLCYELADPITYHLTSQEVRTLLGDNNLWSDAGEMAVTYKADVQLYIDKKLA